MTRAFTAVASVALLVSCGGTASIDLSTDIAPTDVGVWDSTIDYGFAFPNFTSSTYPDELFNVEDITILFGDGPDVCASGSGADCVLTAEATQFAQMVNTARSWGHCEGFSILAAGRFNDGLDPVSFELDDSPDVLHALMRGVASQFLPEVQAEADAWARASLMDKVLYVQESLKDGALDVSLGIYVDDAGHALLPYKVTWDSDDAAQIWVYDSNQPGLTVSVQIDLADNSWRFPYVGGQTWSGGSSMLDLVSIEDRVGQCPFCSSAVEVSRAAFYIRSESPDIGFSVDGEPIVNGSVSADASFRPMKGQQTDAEEDNLGRSVGREVISQAAVEAPLPEITGQGRSEVFYSRASSVISDGVDVELELPGAAAVFIVTDDGLHKFETSSGGGVSVDAKGIAASGGTLTVVSGNSLVQLEGIPGRVTVDFDVEVSHPSGDVITTSLPEGVDSLGIKVDPEDPELLLVTYVNSDGTSYEVTYDKDGMRSPERPSEGLPSQELAADLEALDLAGEELPGLDRQLFATPAEDDAPTTPASTTTTSTVPPTTTTPASTTTSTVPPTTTTSPSTTSTTVPTGTTTTVPETTTTTVPETTTTVPETTTTTAPETTTTTTTTVPPVAQTASLTFDANGGSDAPALVVDDPGATVSVAETSPQRSGFGFNGWNTDAAGTGTSYASGDDYTLPTNDGDVDTLYAQWDPVGFSHVAGSTPLDGNGALQDGSVVELDITVSQGERFIFSKDYLTALVSSFASANSSEHLFIGIPFSSFDAASFTSEDFVTGFKIYTADPGDPFVTSPNDLVFYHAGPGLGEFVYRDPANLTEDAVIEISGSGEPIRLFDANMDNTLTEDAAATLRHDFGDTFTTPRSIYIASVGKGLTLPAASEGAYKIATPTPTPDMLTYAGNIDSLVADGKSDIGHIAVNASGDVFSVTRGSGDAWISKHNSDGVEQWRVATPVTGDKFLAAASDGGVYVGGLDPVSGNGGVVKLDGDGNTEWSQFTAIDAGTIEVDGLDVLEGTSDSGVVFVGKVTGGSGETLTYGALSAAVPTGHAEYIAHVGSDGTPIMIDATARGTVSNFRGYSSVDARPNGSGAWWVAVGSTRPSNSNNAPSCIRFTYDPSSSPPLTEDFECAPNYYSNDVALFSDGKVVAATYLNASTVRLSLFDPSAAIWNTDIIDDVYAPFPANGRGLEVDPSDNIYYSARNVGNNITIQHPDMADVNISIPNFEPNGLLIAFNSDGEHKWTRTNASGSSSRASSVAVSGASIYLGTSAKSRVQIDAYRDKYTWKPSIFRFDDSGASHK